MRKDLLIKCHLVYPSNALLPTAAQTPRHHVVAALWAPISTGKLTDKMNHPFGVYRYYLFCSQFLNKIISFIQVSTFTFIKLGTFFLSLFPPWEIFLPKGIVFPVGVCVCVCVCVCWRDSPHLGCNPPTPAGWGQFWHYSYPETLSDPTGWDPCLWDCSLPYTHPLCPHGRHQSKAQVVPSASDQPAIEAPTSPLFCSIKLPECLTELR